jgi:hypothetical protein
MNQFLKSTMIDKFRKQFESTPGTENIDFDKYLQCAFENLDGKITIAEFLSADMLEIDWIRKQFLNCMAQSKK